jgi:hypothetical protein
MSGDSAGDEALGRAGGVTDVFLSKPFTPGKLTDVLERLLASD